MTAATEVLLDVDGVLGDFVSGVLEFLNEEIRPPVPFQHCEVTSQDILSCFGAEGLRHALDQWIEGTEWCAHIPVYPGAQEFVDTLCSRHTVTVVTARYRAADNWCRLREAWLHRHFGFDRAIFTAEKFKVRGHWLIDDTAANCVAFSEYGRAICFDQPWNQGYKGVRARTYQEVLEIIG